MEPLTEYHTNDESVIFIRIRCRGLLIIDLTGHHTRVLSLNLLSLGVAIFVCFPLLPMDILHSFVLAFLVEKSSKSD